MREVYGTAMKYELALIFLFCSFQDAYGLKNANTQNHDDIVKLIQKANDKDVDITEKTEDRNKAARNRNWAAVAQFDNQIFALKEERKATYEQALWLTIKAYDILSFTGDSPALPNGTSFLRSPEKGKSITWVPIFEDNGPKLIQNEIGRTFKVPELDPDVVGNTASDGVSRILPGAFTSPAALASVIIHEKIHFEQNTTPRTGLELTPGEREVAAYSEEKRILENGTLGESEEINERLQDVGFLLAKKKKQAAIERAKVKKAKGLPIDEYSIASHSGDELNKLVAQAREQVKIAFKDHDDRLLVSLLDLTSISCRSPGSVTPAMLAKLGQPHDENYWRTAAPNDCNEAYIYLAQGGRDARVLRSLSTPPAAVQPLPPPVRPIPPLPPEPRAAQPIRARDFFSMLPLAKDLAVTACQSSTQVPVDPALTRPFREITFSPEFDDQTANNLANGLGDCENRLFRRLIERIRSGEGPQISAGWVQGTAAAYRLSPGYSPGNIAPPSGGRRCEEYGNLHCPH